MTRTILGMLAGVATAILVIMGIEALGHALYPPPAGLDPPRSSPPRPPRRSPSSSRHGWSAPSSARRSARASRAIRVRPRSSSPWW
jgi:hypothetical protein